MPRARVTLPPSFPFATEMSIRITDLNYGRHVGNNTLLALLHEARVQFLVRHGYSELDIEGAGIIMADTVVVFKAEVMYGQTLRIEVAVQDIHRRGCDFVYRVTDKGTEREVARAKTGIVFFDYEQREMLPVPRKFRERFGPASDAP